MNEKAKKHISLGYSIALIVLAAIFTICSILPAIVIDTKKFRYSEIYYTGRYTSQANKVNEINIGFGTVFTAITNWNDISHVFSVQALDDQILIQKGLVETAELALASYVADYTASLMSNYDFTDPDSQEELARTMERLEKGLPVNSTHENYIKAVDNAKIKLAEKELELKEKLDALTPEDKERLADKLQNDEKFLQVIGTVYAFAGYVADDVADAFEGEQAIGTNPLPAVVSLFGIMILIGLIGVAIVYPIIVIIFFIIKLIQFLVNMKNMEDTEGAEKRMDKFPFSGYAATITIMFMLFALLASGGVSRGAGVVGAIVVWVITNALRAAKKILFAEEDRLLVIVKQALTVVSVVAIAVLLVNFSGIDLIGHLDDSMVDLSRAYYDARVEDLSLTMQNTSASGASVYDTARKDVSAANTKNTFMVIGISIAGIVIVASALISAIERFGYKTKKLKGGSRVPYKAMPVLAILVLIVAILPATFGVKTIAERDKAFEDGKFKVCYNEFEIEGSAAKLEYELLKASHEAGIKTVDSLKERVKGADGVLADTLKEELEDAKFELDRIEKDIKDMEAQASRCSVCIAMAVIFVIAEFGYMLAPKFVPVAAKKEEAEVATEAAPVVETPVEEASAEEAPIAEEAEAPAEEEKKEETPAE